MDSKKQTARLSKKMYLYHSGITDFTSMEMYFPSRQKNNIKKNISVSHWAVMLIDISCSVYINFSLSKSIYTISLNEDVCVYVCVCIAFMNLGWTKVCMVLKNNEQKIIKKKRKNYIYIYIYIYILSLVSEVLKQWSVHGPMRLVTWGSWVCW